MDEPARFVARVSAAQGLPTLYRFSYVVDQQKATLAGATHGYEIPFVFDTLDARFSSGLNSQDRQVAMTTQAYWVAFAKTGKPAPAGLSEWPAFNAAAYNLLEFTAAGDVQIQQPGPLKAQIDLVQPCPEARFG